MPVCGEDANFIRPTAPLVNHFLGLDEQQQWVSQLKLYGYFNEMKPENISDVGNVTIYMKPFELI